MLSLWIFNKTADLLNRAKANKQPYHKLINWIKSFLSGSFQKIAIRDGNFPF